MWCPWMTLSVIFLLPGLRHILNITGRAGTPKRLIIEQCFDPELFHDSSTPQSCNPALRVWNNPDEKERSGEVKYPLSQQNGGPMSCGIAMESRGWILSMQSYEQLDLSFLDIYLKSLSPCLSAHPSFICLCSRHFLPLAQFLPFMVNHTR